MDKEPGGLWSVGSQGVGQDWAVSALFSLQRSPLLFPFGQLLHGPAVHFSVWTSVCVLVLDTLFSWKLVFFFFWFTLSLCWNTCSWIPRKLFTVIITRLKFCFSESVFALPLYLVDNLAGVAQRVKESVCNVRDLGWEDTPGGGHGHPLQYSCLENPRTGSLVGYSPRGLKSQTGLSD